MKKRKTFLGLVLVIAVLVLGVGYAALANVPFAINGTATAVSNDDNFKVVWDTLDDNEFTEISEGEYAIANILSSKYVSTSMPNYPEGKAPVVKIDPNSEDEDHKMIISVSGLSVIGETITFTLPVINKSAGITANLSGITTTNDSDNSSYFDINTVFGDSTNLAPNDKGEVIVTVKLLKPVVDKDVTASFSVDFEAAPTVE